MSNNLHSSYSMNKPWFIHAPATGNLRQDSHNQPEKLTHGDKTSWQCSWLINDCVHIMQNLMRGQWWKKMRMNESPLELTAYAEA
jgi:hypothetical protein